MARWSFEDVLGTNYIPTPGERWTITSLVQKMEADLTSLEETISSLLEKREKLNDTMQAHKALLTPARRLLPELVSEVFTHSVPSSLMHLDIALDDEEYGHDPPHFSHPFVSETPLKLGRICRYWRQIALTTPSLWSAIRIPNHWSIEGLQEWIRRSGSCPLSFSVALHNKDHEMLNLLASHQQRWREIVFRCGGCDIGFVKEFIKSLSPCYNNLQTVNLHQWGSPVAGDGDTRAVIRLAIGSAPNLTHLILATPIFQIIVPDRSPPLCLRKIDIESASIAIPDLLSLLRLSPAVESVSAKISFNRSPGITAPSPDIWKLAALKHLEISGFYPRSAMHRNVCPLDDLCLPALEHLSLHISLRRHTREPEYAPNLKSFLRRSRPPLKILLLTGAAIAMPSNELTDSIRILPNLLYLDLAQGDGGGKEIIEFLTGSNPPSGENLLGCICPQLNGLHLPSRKGYVSGPLLPYLVIKMILSRSIGGRSRLEHVTISSCPSHDILADPRISECIANGLEFTGYRNGRDSAVVGWGDSGGWGDTGEWGWE